MIKVKFIAIFFTLFALPIYLFSQNIPSTRVTDWTSPGSSAAFNALNSVTLTSFGADTSGIEASDSALLLALNALQGPGEIFIPKGTYLFRKSIVLPDSIILQGEIDSISLGPLTHLRLAPGSVNHAIVILGSEVTTNYIMTYPLSQGQQKLFVNQPELFSEGDIIRLTPRDDSLLVNDSWAYNSTGQIFEILTIEGDSLWLNKPLRRSYDGIKSPVIFKVMPRRQVHIKCLSIERLDTSVGQTSNIYFNTAADCSVSGIESYYGNYAHIDMINSTRITVENSFFKDAFSYGSGGKGYGIVLEFTTGDCLIDQNIFNHLRHSMILQAGANGNVFAYNYSINPFWTGTVLPSNSAGDIVLHGNYVYMNLFEGNVIQNIVIDNSHGINGPYNTLYRNRAELYGIFMNNSPASNGQNFVGNQVTNTSSFLLGLYSLKGTNHFEYGNMVKGNVMPAGTVEPGDTTQFGYHFSSFYTAISSIPPIKNNNWQSPVPLIEAEYRYQESGKKAVCEEIFYMPSGMEELTEKINPGIVIYPNPFSNEIVIQNKSDRSDYLVKIYNSSGQLVYSGIQRGAKNRIATNTLNPGMYFLVILGQMESVIKLLKQ